jgi:hypothetical protein
MKNEGNEVTEDRGAVEAPKRPSVVARSFTLTLEEIQFLEKMGNDPDCPNVSEYLRRLIDKEMGQYEDDISKILKEIRRLKERTKEIAARIKRIAGGAAYYKERGDDVMAKQYSDEHLNLVDEYQNIEDTLRDINPVLEDLKRTLKIKE